MGDGRGNDLDVLLGEPRRAIRSMVMPFLIAMAVVEINQFADIFWISGLGSSSAEAITTVVPIYGLMMCAGIGIGVGATATIAFRLGRGDTETAGKLASNAVISGIVCAVASSVATAVLISPALELMGAGDVADEGISYLLPYVVLSPVLLVGSILAGTLRGEGAARRSTVMQMSSAAINMAVDPVLIYVLDMGVFGAGLATVLSASVSIMIAVYWYSSGKTVVRIDRSNFRIDGAAMREVLGVGGPRAAQSVISNLTDLAQRVFLIVAGGTTAVMLYNYPWRYIGIVNLPARAYESAMIPVCSAAYGQSDLEKMRVGFVYTAKMAVSFGIVLGAVLFVFAEPLMSVMTYEESMHGILPDLTWTMRVSVFLIPFSAMMGVGSAMLQSMKRSKLPMNFYLIWGFVKLGLYALAAYGFFGIDPFEGIIYSMVAVHVFGAVSLILLSRREYIRIRTRLTAEAAVRRGCRW